MSICVESSCIEHSLEKLRHQNCNVIVSDSYAGSGSPLDQDYSVTIQSGPNRTYGYNDRGSLIWEKDENDDYLVQYEWDVYERLIKVTKGNQITEIDYDHTDRWTRIKESTYDSQTQALTLNKTRHFVWMGFSLIRQVVATPNGGSTDFKTIDYYGEGEVHQSTASTTKVLYSTDYLGSITQMIDASDGSILREFEYDPWGHQTEVYTASGALEATLGFTGHYAHEWSGLVMAPLRAYRPDLGRWIKRDPIKEAGGINLYGYANNLPVIYIDLLGLAMSGFEQWWHYSPQASDFRRQIGLDRDTADFLLGIGKGAAMAPHNAFNSVVDSLLGCGTSDEFWTADIGAGAVGIDGRANFLTNTIGVNAELIFEMETVGFIPTGINLTNLNDDTGLCLVAGQSLPTKFFSMSATANFAYNADFNAEWDGMFYGLGVSNPKGGLAAGVFRGGGWYGANLGGATSLGTPSLPIDGEAVYYIPVLTIEGV